MKLVAEVADRYPTAFSHWLSAADFALGNVKQVAILGESQDQNFKALIKVVREKYHPTVVVAASIYPPKKMPLPYSWIAL